MKVKELWLFVPVLGLPAHFCCSSSSNLAEVALQQTAAGAERPGLATNFGETHESRVRTDYQVIGTSSERYEVVMQNGSDARLEVLASVDGLNVLEGKPAAVTTRV